MLRFPLPYKLALRRGLRLYLFVATIIGSFGLWPAIALHLSELSPSQVVALRFPDLSPAQIVALRFPEVSAFGASTASGSPLLADLIDFQVASTLPPVGHSWFCLRDPDDCKFHAIDLRHPNTGLMPERGNELSSVNRNVNRSIVAELTPANGMTALGTTTATTSGSPLPLFHLIDFQVAPTLPPIGHSGFCLRYPDDCKFRAIDPRHRNMALTPERGNELNVNRNVNRSIFVELTPSNGTTAQSTTTATASGSPSPLEYLIDFRVAPTLPPIGHSRFCLGYPDDCKVHAIDVRHRNIALTPERWNELNSVNRNVNRSIWGNATTEEWAIAPPSGDCKDYAITKRHELLARGWPSRALLLAEVALASGAHHLLLIVRAKSADLVLDNLNDEVRPAAMTYNQYVWVRIQSPQNPKFWMRVLRADAVQTAMLPN